MSPLSFAVSQDGPHIAIVTLSRPEAGNRLTAEDLPALGHAILNAGNQPDVKVVLVKAQGDQFCMGRDPGAAAPSPKSALQIRNGVTEPILGIYEAIRATPVPVVAIVQGERAVLAARSSDNATWRSHPTRPPSHCRKWTPIFHRHLRSRPCWERSLRSA